MELYDDNVHRASNEKNERHNSGMRAMFHVRPVEYINNNIFTLICIISDDNLHDEHWIDRSGTSYQGHDHCTFEPKAWRNNWITRFSGI